MSDAVFQALFSYRPVVFNEGDFTFDVASRTVTLEYNERVMQSEYSEHVF